MSEPVYVGFQKPSSGNSETTALTFFVQQMLARVWTSTLVKVQKVQNDGGVSPVGFVDVLPLVAQVDGRGRATPHSVIHNLPYMRLQGGANAVILDPQVGDIGLAVFASRDISAVKTARGPATPGSFRRFDPADGLYVGGFLNGTPEQYVRFSEEGVEILSPTQVRIQAPQIELDGDVTVTGSVTGQEGAEFENDVVASGISVSTHVHGGVQTGGSSTGGPE